MSTQRTFEFIDGTMHFDGVNLNEVAAKYKTPSYIYSREMIENNWKEYNDAFGSAPHLVCYAVKANSNIALLNVMAELGSGFDIVSIGELERVVAAKGDPSKVLFSGVGKSAKEIARALELGIKCINIESEAELEHVNQVAKDIGVVAPISLRINPNVDPKTHPYISTGLKENKFGITIEDARRVYNHANNLENIKVSGVDCHIGSQLTDDSPYFDAVEILLNLIDQLEEDGIKISHLDVGGGIGICYEGEQTPDIKNYVERLIESVKGRDIELIVEPGRSIVGNAGLMLTKVEYLKPGDHKNFAIVDAAMNDLLRPSLYAAWQDIVPVNEQSTAPERTYDIVGPICETGDFIGKDRTLAVEQGDILAVCSAGAYGFSMSSNYNSRPRSVELMVDTDKEVKVVRKRESIEDLFSKEKIL